MKHNNSQHYTVLTYDPALRICNLQPSSGTPGGILRDVPIGCWWGGSWENQVSHEPSVTGADISSWPSLPHGPQWGEGYPVQPGDWAEVTFMNGDHSAPVVTAFTNQVGGRGIPNVARAIGEPTVDRYDLLHPSGAWLRIHNDGTWLITTPSVDSPSCQIKISASGEITIDAGSVTVNSDAFTVNAGSIDLNGLTKVSGKEVTVIGGTDSAGHPIVNSGQ